jgi:hypothetical protein
MHKDYLKFIVAYYYLIIGAFLKLFRIQKMKSSVIKV